jgi:hypothetical protein
MRHFFSTSTLVLLATLSAPVVFAACASETAPVGSAEPSTGEPSEDAGRDPSAKDVGNAAGDAGDATTGDAADAADTSVITPDASPASPVCPAPALPAPACANGVVGVFTSKTMAFANLDDLRGVRAFVDRGGFFHVIGTSMNTNRPWVVYLTNRSGAWQREIVAQSLGRPMDRVREARLGIDSCGQPSVVFLREHQPAGAIVADRRVFLATRSSTGAWTDAEIPVPTSAVDATPSSRVYLADLAEEPSGALHVAVHLYSGSLPMVLTRSAGSTTFAIERVDTGANGPTLPAITWSPILGAVLADVTVGYRPRIAFKVGGAWTSHEVTGGVGMTTSGSDGGPKLGVHADAVGAVHVAWQTSSSIYSGNELYYARYANGAFSAPVAIASIEPSVVAYRTVGNDIRIVASPAGIPFVSHGAYYGPQWAHPTPGATPSGWTSHEVSKSQGWSAGVADSTGRGYLITTSAAGLDLRTQACAP